MDTFDPFQDDPAVKHVVNTAGSVVTTTSGGVDVKMPGMPLIHGATIEEACELEQAAEHVIA